MLPEAGTFALILALCFALIQAVAPLRFFPRSLGTVATVGQALFLALSMLILMISLAECDFTVLYVQAHTHPTLPFWYRIGAAWGGHEGSLLLWCLVMAAWTLVFAVSGKRLLSHSFHARVLSILGFTSAGFLLFLLFTSNPFWRIFSLTPLTGDDLMPVLQDPGLIFHPPMLYSGYVGFSIAFAFATGLLLSKKIEPHWARALRPWVVVPWALLGSGIVLGSWWSYRELGWGGWWFWDPVENASLMPWLSATALMHSLMVTEKRQSFAGMSVLLALVTFALSLLGTFLVRSGVLVSVHAFATDPSRGIFLLSYMAFLIGGSFLLYALRIGRFYHRAHFSLLSRETLLLANTVLLLSAVVILLTGTLYPIILDALNKGKLSVGEPYFTALFTPLMLCILLLMVFQAHVRWGRGRWPAWQQSGPLIAAGLLVAFVLPCFLHQAFHALTTLGLFAGGAMLMATAQQFKKSSSPGMLLAHTGVAILAIGITVNQSYSQERQLRIYPRDTVRFASYDFQFNKQSTAEGPNYTLISAHFAVSRNQHPVGEIIAEQRTYTSHTEAFSHPGILYNAFRDLYIAPGNVYTDGSWMIRLYYRPFVRWIWAGGLIIMAGGLLSIISRRKTRA